MQQENNSKWLVTEQFRPLNAQECCGFRANTKKRAQIIKYLMCLYEVISKASAKAESVVISLLNSKHAKSNQQCYQRTLRKKTCFDVLIKYISYIMVYLHF